MSPARQSRFSLRSMIQDLLYAHDKNEFSEFFCAGARSTTPPLCTIDARWHFVWRSALFTLALIIFILAFMVAEYWAREALHNTKLFWGAIVVGSIAVPLGLISVFAEMNLWRNISWLRISVLTALGGALSLCLALILFFANFNESTFNAGFIEEPAKIIAVLILAGKRGRNGYVLNGMLLGAAVGAGFAIFESLGYAYESLFVLDTDTLVFNIDYQNALSVMAVRSIFCLTAGHLTWTAITCAALWKCMQGRSLWRAIMHPLFLFCLVASALIHGYWNLGAMAGHMLILAPVFGFFTWGFIAALNHWGITQIRAKQVEWLRDNAQVKMFYIKNEESESIHVLSAHQLVEKIEDAELEETDAVLVTQPYPHQFPLKNLFFIRALRRGRGGMNWYEMPPSLWFRFAQILGLGSVLSLSVVFIDIVYGIAGYIFCSSILTALLLRHCFMIWERVRIPADAHDDEGSIEMPAMGDSLWLKLFIPLYQIYWGYVLLVRVLRCVNLTREGRMRIPLWIPRLYWTTFYMTILICLFVLMSDAASFGYYALFLIILYPCSAFLMSLALMSAEKGK